MARSPAGLSVPDFGGASCRAGAEIGKVLAPERRPRDGILGRVVVHDQLEHRLAGRSRRHLDQPCLAVAGIDLARRNPVLGAHPAIVDERVAGRRQAIRAALKGGVDAIVPRPARPDLPLRSGFPGLWRTRRHGCSNRRRPAWRRAAWRGGCRCRNTSPCRPGSRSSRAGDTAIPARRPAAAAGRTTAGASWPGFRESSRARRSPGRSGSGSPDGAARR